MNKETDWSSYDGHKPRKKLPAKDRHGREVPDNPIHDKPMRRFFAETDRSRLIDALSEDPKYEAFIKALHSPEYVHDSPMKIAKEFHVTLHELQMLYSSYTHHIMLLNLANHGPKVADDQGRNAENKMVLCPRCDGLKAIKDGESERTCPECEGVGKVEREGNDKSVALVMESMKVTGIKAPLVAINQNFGNQNQMDMRLEEMLKLTQKVGMDAILAPRNSDAT